MTYTQTPGGADGSQYFQDVAIGPASLKDGSLKQRLDPKRYPRVGVDNGPAAGGVTPTVTVTADNSAPVHGTAVVLTATVTGPAMGRYPKGDVTFKDGATTVGTATLGAGVASLNVPSGFTAGTHHITAVFPGDGLFDAGTSPVHDVVAS
jgi:hypothetical protein